MFNVYGCEGGTRKHGAPVTCPVSPPLRGVPPAFQMDFMNLRNAGLLKFTTKRRLGAWGGNQTSGMTDPVPSTLLLDQSFDTTLRMASPNRSVSDVPA